MRQIHHPPAASVAEPDVVLRDMSESVMREVVGAIAQADLFQGQAGGIDCAATPGPLKIRGT